MRSGPVHFAATVRPECAPMMRTLAIVTDTG